jgi:uncharacterized sulfatase
MGSLLTGLHPFNHGLTPEGNAIATDLTTVAERFGEAGYYTAGLSANAFFSPATGLNRGFDRFEWVRPHPASLLSSIDVPILLKWLIQIRKYSGGITTDTRKHSAAYLLLKQSKRWIQELNRREQPFFLCAQFIEPHIPYHPPKPYLSKFVDETGLTVDEAVKMSLDVYENRYEIVADGGHLSDPHIEALTAMYDAELSYVDELMGSLFEFMYSMNSENTILLITSDHGDLLGEYDAWFHSHLLVDELTHVPLVTYNLDGIDNSEPIQHGDLMKTLLSRAGAETTGMNMYDLDDGTRPYIVTQRPYRHTFPKEREFVSDYSNPYCHTDPVTGIKKRRYKLKHSADRTELFMPPDEYTDQSDQYPETCEELSESLDSVLDACGGHPRGADEAMFDDQMEQQLRDLGYL